MLRNSSLQQLGWSAWLLVYLDSTYFVQVHDQARQHCQFKETFFFQTIDRHYSCKSFSIGSQDYYNTIIILLRIQICGGRKDGNIKRIEMPLKQSIFVYQIQMLRSCFWLIIYNWISDIWLSLDLFLWIVSFLLNDLILYSWKWI